MSIYLRDTTLVSIATAAFLCLSASARSELPPQDPVAAYAAFVTHCPPIKNLVLGITLNQERSATFYQFRYQTNAFFVRALGRSPDEADSPVGTRDFAGGHFEETYWFLNSQRLDRPTLHTLENVVGERNISSSHAYSTLRRLKDLFGFFTTLGLSSEGMHRVVLRDGAVTLLGPSQGKDGRVTLTLSNGLLAAAGYRVFFAEHQKWRDYRVRYAYNPTLCPTPVPERVALALAGYEDHPMVQFAVLRLELGDPAAPLPKEIFCPTRILGQTNLSRIIHTNGQEYYLTAHGMLRPTKVSKAEAVRELERRTPPSAGYLVSVLFTTLLLIPIVLVMSKYRTKHRNH